MVKQRPYQTKNIVYALIIITFAMTLDGLCTPDSTPLLSISVPAWPWGIFYVDQMVLEPGKQYYVLAEGTWSYISYTTFPMPWEPSPAPQTHTQTYDAEWYCYDGGAWVEKDSGWSSDLDLFVGSIFDSGILDSNWLGSPLSNPDPINDFDTFAPHTFSPSHRYWLPMVNTVPPDWPLFTDWPIVIMTRYFIV
jgi:hypothetical protein